jgi:hypothetical protein
MWKREMTLPRRTTLIMAILLGFITSLSVAAYVVTPLRGEGWRNIAWPFPRDGWPPGQAWRCLAASCGADMELYVRPKIGFCNCDSGVADDDEVDRVADLDLISPRFRALHSGEVIRIGDMPGRMRPYELGDNPSRQAVGMAVSRKCDLMVAVVQGTASATDLQRQALAFMGSSEATRWIKSAMNVSPR